eukprot:3771054-Pleurochrysis_carterae.AAC.1
MATAARARPPPRRVGTVRALVRRTRDPPAPPARTRVRPASPVPPPLRPAALARSLRSYPS